MSIRIVRFLDSIKNIEDPYKQIELIEEEKEMFIKIIERLKYAEY